MADAASACRRTTRASQQPLSLAEEQAAVTLSALEQRDVAAALRLSLQDSWDSDEEKSGAERDAEAESSSSEEEEEKQAAAPAEEEEEWTDNLHAVDVPLPRLRHERQPAPAEDTPLRLLQRFLPPALMEEFAQHTNAAAPHDWRPSTAAELYAFLGAHLFMGIDRLPRTELYWSSTFGHPLITSLFSRDRFKELLRCFRVRALGRGEWIQRQKGDATVAVWRDQQPLWVLYNHCSPSETASLDRWSDAGRKVSIGCPRAIRDYFYGARSVDVLSQLHYAYLPGRKAQRSWPRLAWWLLDMCVINAFQLWSKGQQHPGQLRFREELMHELVAQMPAEQKPHRASRRPEPADSPAKDHFPELVQTPRDCEQCSLQSEKRVRSSYICHTCRVHLCCSACFGLYHA